VTQFRISGAIPPLSLNLNCLFNRKLGGTWDNNLCGYEETKIVPDAFKTIFYYIITYFSVSFAICVLLLK
jgi:hypothetical protein